MSLKNPNKQESDWMQRVADFGCIACYVSTGIRGTPCAVHHITFGGRRISHLHTIGLCNPGHHKDRQPDSGKEPYHHNAEKFCKAYGSPDELLVLTRELLGVKP